MKKTHQITLVAILTAVLCFSGNLSAYSGGSGTISAPYQIATKADLLALATNAADYGKCFILTADIDLGGQVFTTAIIAANTGPSNNFQGTAFNGTFNGNGHKITHFKVNGGYSYLGFFGQNNGFVKNLGLENFSVIGNGSLYTSNCCIGGFAGENDGSIINCYSTGTVSGSNYSYAGGLVGNNYGSIGNCYSTGKVNGLACVGGLVGMNVPGNILNCYSTGKVSGGTGSYYIGGLIGFNVVYSNIISGNFWNITTSGTSFGVGDGPSAGVTGKTTAEMKTLSTFTDAGWDFSATWQMPANSYPRLAWEAVGASGAYNGGSGTASDPYKIATKADLLTLSGKTADYGKCFIMTANIDMQGQFFTTAIIAPDTSSSSFFQGTAFTGTFDGNGHKITNLTINGGSNWYLGLFGEVNPGGSIKNIGLENCAVSGTSGSACVGGLVGANNGGSISNCYSSGTVTGHDNSQCLGGLVGANYQYNINNCYSTVTVTGGNNSQDLGGLVGYSNGSISNCYSTGSVDGIGQYSNLIGGLMGQNGGSISNCYSKGLVNGDSTSNYIGGLVGYNFGSVSGSFWDTQTSGQTIGIGSGSSAGVSGETTSQMKTLSTFTDAGWDFSATWQMPTNNYPQLAWQKGPLSNQVKKCSVTAGSKVNSDTISFSGVMNPTDADILAATEIVVTVDSADMVNPCIMTFPINTTTYKKGAYNYTLKAGALQSSFKLSTKTGAFSFSAKNVDLTGLACPVTVTIQIGDYSAQLELAEDIVNGTKPIPFQLMMGVQNMLVADKVSVKRSSKLNSDSLTVSGRFTTAGEPDLSNPMVITVGSQTLTVSGNQFLSKNGVESCKAVSNEGPLVTAKLDYVKCTFNISLKNASITQHGIEDFGIDCFGVSLNGMETVDLGQ